MLGSAAGFCHVGESIKLWRRASSEKWLCGCGLPFRCCEFWNSVLVAAFDGLQPGQAREFENLRLEVHRQLIAHRGDIDSPETREYATLLGKLYSAIESLSGCDVIVDSSKTAELGWLLARLPGVRLTVVRLVRDPMAVAFSWTRKKQVPVTEGVEYMQTRSVADACSIWSILNRRADRLAAALGERAFLVRYEDFAANPKVLLRAVMEIVSDAESFPEFVSEKAFRVKTSHSVSGNPDRYHYGDVVEIAVDDTWTESMNPSDRLLAESMTEDLRQLYGYA